MSDILEGLIVILNTGGYRSYEESASMQTGNTSVRYREMQPQGTVQSGS